MRTTAANKLLRIREVPIEDQLLTDEDAALYVMEELGGMVSLAVSVNDFQHKVAGLKAKDTRSRDRTVLDIYKATQSRKLAKWADDVMKRNEGIKLSNVIEVLLSSLEELGALERKENKELYWNYGMLHENLTKSHKGDIENRTKSPAKKGFGCIPRKPLANMNRKCDTMIRSDNRETEERSLVPHADRSKKDSLTAVDVENTSKGVAGQAMSHQSITNVVSEAALLNDVDASKCFVVQLMVKLGGKAALPESVQDFKKIFAGREANEFCGDQEAFIIAIKEKTKSVLLAKWADDKMRGEEKMKIRKVFEKLLDGLEELGALKREGEQIVWNCDRVEDIILKSKEEDEKRTKSKESSERIPLKKQLGNVNKKSGSSISAATKNSETAQKSLVLHPAKSSKMYGPRKPSANENNKPTGSWNIARTMNLGTQQRWVVHRIHDGAPKRLKAGEDSPLDIDRLIYVVFDVLKTRFKTAWIPRNNIIIDEIGIEVSFRLPTDTRLEGVKEELDNLMEDTGLAKWLNGGTGWEFHKNFVKPASRKPVLDAFNKLQDVFKSLCKLYGFSDILYQEPTSKLESVVKCGSLKDFIIQLRPLCEQFRDPEEQMPGSGETWGKLKLSARRGLEKTARRLLRTSGNFGPLAPNIHWPHHYSKNRYAYALISRETQEGVVEGFLDIIRYLFRGMDPTNRVGDVWFANKDRRTTDWEKDALGNDALDGYQTEAQLRDLLNCPPF